MEDAPAYSTSLVELQTNDIAPQLESIFKASNQSPEVLSALFQKFCPLSSSVYASIIQIYSNSLRKPRITKLLDKIIDYLHLNDKENLHRYPYCSEEIKIYEKSEYCDLLHSAIQRNHGNIFQLLLRTGFNPNGLLFDHKTPLSIIVVASNINPEKRLEYIQLLIEHGAHPLKRDKHNISPFKRLCGLKSNYPIVYRFFRDHLLSVYADDVQFEFNAGLENAFFYSCLPMVVDLLEHGAILDVLKTVNSFEHFLSDIASANFVEPSSISNVDTLTLCLVEIILHANPCENYPMCIEKFIQLIYLPSVRFPSNLDPLNQTSVNNFKKLFHSAIHYGYLNRTSVHHIRKNIRLQLSPLGLPALQSLIKVLEQYLDDLSKKYHQQPVPLKLLVTRKIRQSMTRVNQQHIQQLRLHGSLNDLLFCNFST